VKPAPGDIRLREIQKQVLRAIARIKDHPFALVGGSALEIYYLHHRFSRDLDFFARDFTIKRVEQLLSEIKKSIPCTIEKGSRFLTERKAQVAYYLLNAVGLKDPLDLHFVEDVILKHPRIVMCEGLPVYSVEDIYYLKILAVSGLHAELDAIGRIKPTGRNAPRDAVDIYYLSRKIRPLHLFLQKVPRYQQHMFIRWARTYSRLDMKLHVLDLEVYDPHFDVRDMIKHMDDEINQFMKGVL